MKLKKIISLLCVLLLACAIFTGCQKKVGDYSAEIVIKDFGTIYVELDSEEAPITVENFVKLAQEGFYDGSPFHRIINGFMMQGGASATGKVADTIKGEFAANGVDNSIAHERGVISMARAAISNDSASSQFFIMHRESPRLNGQYAAFGHVTEGMDIVDTICENTPVTDNNGTVPAEAQPIIETIRIITAE